MTEHSPPAAPRFTPGSFVTYHHRDHAALGVVLKVSPNGIAHVRSIAVDLEDFGWVNTIPAVVPVEYLVKLEPSQGAIVGVPLDVAALSSPAGRDTMVGAMKLMQTLGGVFRGAVRYAEFQAVYEPVLGMVEETPSEDLATAVVGMLLAGASGGSNAVLARILAVPVDDLAREAWGTDPACTTYEDLVEEHEAADEDEKDTTQLAKLRCDVERLRGLLLRAAIGLPARTVETEIVSGQTEPAPPPDADAEPKPDTTRLPRRPAADVVAEGMRELERARRDPFDRYSIGGMVRPIQNYPETPIDYPRGWDINATPKGPMGTGSVHEVAPVGPGEMSTILRGPSPEVPSVGQRVRPIDYSMVRAVKGDIEEMLIHGDAPPASSPTTETSGDGLGLDDEPTSDGEGES